MTIPFVGFPVELYPFVSVGSADHARLVENKKEAVAKRIGRIRRCMRSMSLARLRPSCIIDGEAVACDDNGMPSFDSIRYWRRSSTASTSLN